MTEQEKRDYFNFERTSQSKVDPYYLMYFTSIDRSVSCKQFDCIIDGTEKVEEKFRTVERNDILLEMIQDLQTNAPGWFYETQCDYLHYIFMQDTEFKKLYRFDWKKFKPWCYEFFKNNKHPYTVVSPKGWGITLNLSVPINAIPQYLYAVITKEVCF